MRTIPNLSDHLQPLEDVISNDFVPSLFGSKVKDLVRRLIALPPKLGGMGITNPIEIANNEYENSIRLTQNLLSIYIPWPFPPVWGVADNTEETTKQWGFHSVLLAMTRDPAEFGWHCWSNTAHPPPSSTTYVASYIPSPLLPLPPGCLYKATPWQQQMPIRTASQSFATHSYP